MQYITYNIIHTNTIFAIQFIQCMERKYDSHRPNVKSKMKLVKLMKKIIGIKCKEPSVNSKKHTIHEIQSI